jgi:hypothetical protein
VIVTLHQYRAGDAKTTVESGERVVDQEPGAYFDTDALGPDEGWNQFADGDRILQRRVVTYEGVTELSVPEGVDIDLDRDGDGDGDAPDDLPGATVQLVADGETAFVDGAQVVEVVDAPA